MSVRIIFRGLILFQFPETGKDAGKLVALLVNKRSVTEETSSAVSKTAQPHGPWEHRHNPDYQVLDGRGNRAAVVPRQLDPGVHLDITVPPTAGSPESIVKSRSFLRHVPNLDNIIERGSPAVQKSSRGKPSLGPDLVSNFVKVNRGTVLVRDVVNWDEANYPLSGNPADKGEHPRTPAVAKFMGSDVDGHMASEVIVQIDDANSVVIDSNKKDIDLGGRHEGVEEPNPHVPENTVEIVVTNYEYQRGTPVPWSFDFQWLFEVAGYGEVDLAGREFDAWVPFAMRYSRTSGLFESDRALLLKDGTIGRPFPYLESEDALTRLNPLTNELERPLCASGTTTSSILPPT